MSNTIYVKSPTDIPQMPTGSPLFFILKRQEYIPSAYRYSDGYPPGKAWDIEVFTNEQDFQEAAKKLCDKGLPTEVIFLKGDQIIPRMNISF